jgi:hypothetical protein
MQPITADELAKAAANLTRIENYLLVRTQWRTEENGESALRSIGEGAVRITRALDPYRDTHPITIDLGDAKLTEQMPSETFDSSRVAKLGDFMVRLSGWFKGRAGSDLAPGTEQLIGSIYSSLIRIHRAVESILGGSSSGPAAAEPHSAPSHPTTPSGSPPPPGEPRPSPAEASGQPIPLPPPTSAEARSDRLVLENTVQTPLLEALQDEFELTDEARRMVAGFLEKNGIEFADHKLRRFHTEVRRCIERTPDGQVLVIKVGGVDGDRTPFFTYQPKAWFDSQ